MEQGDGPVPTASDRVTVHYRGQLVDGTEFDTSYDGEPATFAVNGVIAGWTEALQLMSVGGKYRLVIPSELAYGERGSGPVIGPNATLVFEVELLAIEP
jgi:FKBP-type peptidyl-prolyl cis-trans isomerase FklB